MNDSVIISVESLGKKYRIAHQAERQRYTALRDVVATKFKGLFRRRRTEKAVFGTLSAPVFPHHEDFWALKDVSFEVKRGDVVGIIGRNGAGKSTLLKVLSRITDPTEGRVRIKGLVASLLEVGTGFHPELTGRENIFLNGSILGMTRVEIKKRFDEIVAFAEVATFLDTPVKRYSSGMYVRLAFAVAAHLEPEILIVDEVLSVGDAEFQKKCLGKLKDVSADGRTVLYVTHNLPSVTKLCNRGILLNNGKLGEDTTAEGAVNSYLQISSDNPTAEPHILFVDATSSADDFRVVRVEMLNDKDQPKPVLRPMDFVTLRVWFILPSGLREGSIVLELTSMDGTVVLKLESNPRRIQAMGAGRGLHYADCCVASLPLMEGRYGLGVGLAIYGVRFLTWTPDAASLLISESTLGSGSDMSLDRKGLIVVDHEWKIGEPVAC